MVRGLGTRAGIGQVVMIVTGDWLGVMVQLVQSWGGGLGADWGVGKGVGGGGGGDTANPPPPPPTNLPMGGL